jgi:hypothetical protein
MVPCADRSGCYDDSSRIAIPRSIDVNEIRHRLLSLMDTTGEIEHTLAGLDLSPDAEAEAGNQLALALDELDTVSDLLANATDPAPVEVIG